MRGFLKRARTPGQATLEMAVTFPVVFVIILGVLELGFVFNAYTTVVTAARSGARAGAVYLYSPTASPTANQSNRESGSGMTPAYVDNVRDTVAQSLSVLRGGDPAFNKSSDIVIGYTPANPHFDNGKGDLINVSVTYHYRFLTTLINTNIDLQGQASERIE